MQRCWLELDKTTRVADLDANATPGFDGKAPQARKALEELRTELIDLQQRLFAQGQQSLLIVLQAMDTGGKDGTIRRVFSGVNPNGVSIARFAAPSAQELAHDYLWRVHSQTPGKGEICIFNRSHYEDVLVVRVNDLVPRKVWRKRFNHIKAFENLLVDEGTTIIKFFLHIDSAEQAARLQARLDDPAKHWKFDEHDLVQRARWNDYMLAFDEAIRQTSTKRAPWYIIPANRKWFRDYAVMTILVDTLRRMNPQYPPAADFDPKAIRIDEVRS